MVKLRELQVMLRYSKGVRHDFLKYLISSKWFRLFYENRSIKDSHFSAASASFNALAKDMDTISGFISRKDIKSKEFKAAVRNLQANIKKFEGEMLIFKKSGCCPARLARKINVYLVPFKMLHPLSNVWLEGKLTLHKTRFKLRPLVKTLEFYFKNSLVAYMEKGAKVSFNVEGNPTIYADRVQLQRAMFNLFHDAVTHSLGEDVAISAKLSKNNIVFSTTNLGRKLQSEIIRRVGRLPYESAIGQKDPRGHGKVAAKDIVIAHNGRFQAKNMPKGFSISIKIPQKPKVLKRRRIA